MQDATILERTWALILSVLAYATGEVGRVYIAGAVGGLVRWHAMEGRRLIGGVLAAVGGVIAVVYLSPLYAALLDMVGIRLGDDAGVQQTLGFIAGLSGMTVVKLAVALIEAELSLRLRRAERAARDGGDDE